MAESKAVSYVAAWPLVCVKDSTGRTNQFYAGSVIPDGVPTEELKRHVDAGAIVPLS